MGLVDIHNILFNAHVLYCVLLGGWAFLTALRRDTLTGGFWGAIASGSILAGVIMLVGILLLLQGFQLPRAYIYLLYMAWLVVTLPGLFALRAGRDDANAALTFAILAFFNAATSLSMAQRFLTAFTPPVS